MTGQATPQLVTTSGRGPVSRWQIMSEAVRAFAQVTGAVDQLVPTVARHLGEAVNATCMVRLLSGDRRFLNPSALWCPEPTVEPLLRRTVAAAPIRLRSDTTAFEAIDSSSVLSYDRVSLEDLGVELRPEHAYLREQIEPGPIALASLRQNNEGLGLVYLIRRPSEPGFGRDELEFVQDLTGQAAVALGHALRIEALVTENQTFRRDSASGNDADQQSRQLDAVAALASGLARDYDNLISVIQMCTNLRQDALDTEDPMQDELDELRRAIERAADLAPKLAVLARRRQLMPEILDPAAIVQQLQPGLAGLLGPHHSLQVEIRAAQKTAVCVDRPQLTEAITQLVLHAQSATPDQGQVRLFVDTATVGEDTLIGVPEGRYSVIAVQDEGIGLTPDAAERLFRPDFVRAMHQRATGLGLASALAFAQESGGTITVTSRPGLATTVSLFLPVVTDAGFALLDPRLHGIETVLLAVEDVAYRAYLRALLRRHGYQVLDVQTPDLAAAVASAYAEPIHLLIVDASATDLIEALRGVRPESALLTSGLASSSAPSQLARGQQEGEILSRVRRALSKHGRG